MNDTRTTNETNVLGIAGFVVSLVGLCSAGILSPIGLIMSLVALGKRPKGFAIAGVVLGALGSCGIILGLIMLPLVLIAAGLALAAAGAVGIAGALSGVGGPEIEAQFDAAFLTMNVEQYYNDNGSYPMTLAEGTQKLDASSKLRTDHWGNPYLYMVAPDRTKFWIFSAGPDGIAGSADDIMSEITKEKFGPPPSMSAPAIEVAPAAPAESPETPEPAQPPSEGSSDTPAAPEKPE